MNGAPIRLLVVDIDGCLTPGGWGPFDLRPIQLLRRINELARDQSELYPQATFLTGRPQGYMESLMQAIDCTMPAICENGSYMFRITGRQEWFHPELPADFEKRLTELIRAVKDELADPGEVIEQGKVTSLTLVPAPGKNCRHHEEKAHEIIARLGGAFEVGMSSGCLHFMFKKTGKGPAIPWLAEQVGIPPEQMAGIGDSAVDMPFLERVGLSAVPAQAPDVVKQSVDLRCEAAAGACIIEFAKAAIERNLDATHASESDRQEFQDSWNELIYSIYRDESHTAPASTHPF